MIEKEKTKNNVFINFSNHPSSNWSEKQKKRYPTNTMLKL